MQEMPGGGFLVGFRAGREEDVQEGEPRDAEGSFVKDVNLQFTII